MPRRLVKYSCIFLLKYFKHFEGNAIGRMYIARREQLYCLRSRSVATKVGQGDYVFPEMLVDGTVGAIEAGIYLLASNSYKSTCVVVLSSLFTLCLLTAFRLHEATGN